MRRCCSAVSTAIFFALVAATAFSDSYLGPSGRSLLCTCCCLIPGHSARCDLRLAAWSRDLYKLTHVIGRGGFTSKSLAGEASRVMPSCGCMVNYPAPNHLEDYVHRVRWTGQAINCGVEYKFVNSMYKAKFAPIVVQALVKAGHLIDGRDDNNGWRETKSSYCKLDSSRSSSFFSCFSVALSPELFLPSLSCSLFS
jgi:hypothetical protein